MKNFLSRVLHGFAFGVGLAIALALGIYVADRLSTAFRGAGTPGKSKVTVTFSQDTTTPKGRTVVGTVTNDGSEVSVYEQITVDFFDAEGRLIDTCTDGVPGGLKPAAVASFKVECDDPDAPKLHPHSTFKVRTDPSSDEGGP